MFFSWYRSCIKQYTFDSVQCSNPNLGLLITFKRVPFTEFYLELWSAEFLPYGAGKFEKVLAGLKTEEIEVSNIVTDRDSQVKVYMKREQPQIVHMFDVWQVAKGMHYVTIIVHD